MLLKIALEVKDDDKKLTTLRVPPDKLLQQLDFIKELKWEVTDVYICNSYGIRVGDKE